MYSDLINNMIKKSVYVVTSHPNSAANPMIITAGINVSGSISAKLLSLSSLELVEDIL